ncbi:MAG: hypothetical protein VX998_01395, partial [Candidatus Thermoplasmatota archaeon]|nr:hypothetical protein [Candidatus Thermoplasmatota archaeon]
MDTRVVALAIFGILFASSITVLLVGVGEEAETSEPNITFAAGDPLFQGEGHDHSNASQHEAGTDNIEQLAFNPLTSPGNAEVSVARSPDGRVYTYQAGWNDMHIVDVTNASDPQVVGVYNDPNTQVLDVKYLEYNGNEYVILQNQLVDSGYADPNVGEWGDPSQVSVVLIDVTDKTNPTYVDSWYDVDHPSGPHNLYPHMIDGEWYIFVANPDYEQCDSALGEACGGVTIAHLNLQGSASRTLPGIPASGVGHTIIKVGEYEVAWETTRGGWIYIHDMTVQRWPGEDTEDPRYGRTFIYGSYWEAGLRIGDVTDVPHPVNSPAQYTTMATLCKAGQGNPVMCRWRAPEVGSWMDFLDLDNDGQPDSGTTGNENGGRVSYIHYAEPFPEMLDVSHLGLGDEPRHYVTAAVECLDLYEGTGIVYLLDTTEYSMENGNFKFEISMTRDWEIPYATDHCFGSSCELDPVADEWLLFSPHNLDSGYFETTEETDQSRGGTWDGRLYISHYHAGVWIVDVETLISPFATDRIDINFEATVGYYLPRGHLDGTPLDSAFYDFSWVPFLWAVEFHEGRI